MYREKINKSTVSHYMPIIYAEITIIFNLEKETMSNYFNRLLLGNENQTTDNDTIIILFEEEVICDVKKECINSKIIMEMGPKFFDLPLYFDTTDKNKTFFSKSPQECNGIRKMDFNPIFANCKKHRTTKKEESIYNCIYYVLKDKIDVLAIVRINTSDTQPRFLLAYDDEYFKKECIIYFVNYIFSTP
jgi:hypothetical protein